MSYKSRYTLPSAGSSGDGVLDERARSHTPSHQRQRKVSRTAIVLRAWDSFKWTEEDMTHLRSLVSEAQSLSNREFSIHILLHVKNQPKVETMSKNTTESAGMETVPDEFRSITEPWTYEDCQERYPSVGEYE